MSMSAKTSHKTETSKTETDHPGPLLLDPDTRLSRIAEAAYYRAELRGFATGYELEDWLAAEAEIDGLDTSGGKPAY